MVVGMDNEDKPPPAPLAEALEGLIDALEEATDQALDWTPITVMIARVKTQLAARCES